MKITGIEAIHLRLPELDAKRCDGTQDTLIVKVHTDEGITGIGEVDSNSEVAKAVIEAKSFTLIGQGLQDLLLGEDPFQYDRLWNKMYDGTTYYGRFGPVIHAISGIDMALWDIMGQATGKPVAVLLGGLYRSKVKAYASNLFPDTYKEAAQMAEKYVTLGYKAMKFGWGSFGFDPGFDLGMIKTIRDAIGDRVDLMIDVGYRWDVQTTVEMAKRLEEYRPFWIEEPLSPDDLAGYSRLAGRVNANIAAGESESGRRAYQRLMDEAKVDIIQPDLARCGGLTEGMKIARMAADRQVKVVPHAFKTGVLVAASVHFALSIPNGFLVEYTVTDSPLTRDLVSDPVEYKDGYLCFPDRPGLGIALDEKTVRAFRVG